jgi:cytochrome c5
MNCFISLKHRLATLTSIALVLLAVSALFLPMVYAGGDSKAVTAPAATTGDGKPTGAELYAMHCNRCHAERYPKEFQAAQWQTIMIHMRVRANLPASQAKEILKYLQEESGS